LIKQYHRNIPDGIHASLHGVTVWMAQIERAVEQWENQG